MLLTCEQRLKGAKILLGMQIVFSLVLWVFLAFTLFKGTGDFAVGFRQALEEQSGSQDYARIFGALSMPIFVAIGVAAIAIGAMKRRARNWTLLAGAMLAFEILAGLMNGGYPVFAGVAFLLLLRRDVLEYLNAWPRKST